MIGEDAMIDSSIGGCDTELVHSADSEAALNTSQDESLSLFLSTLYTLSTVLSFSKNGIRSFSCVSDMSSNQDATGTCSSRRPRRIRGRERERVGEYRGWKTQRLFWSRSLSTRKNLLWKSSRLAEDKRRIAV